jgi:hypothetical protein
MVWSDDKIIFIEFGININGNGTAIMVSGQDLRKRVDLTVFLWGSASSRCFGILISKDLIISGYHNP